MDALMATGFITPPSLHYVRNHGAVPKRHWASHRVTINGLVDGPLTLSMDELIALPCVTLPITLVCAGNRRKEENMHKKSIGFNWGPCAVSTSYWTGVRMSTLLKMAGVKEGAGYVCFRGPQGELPKGDDGSYGARWRGVLCAAVCLCFVLLLLWPVRCVGCRQAAAAAAAAAAAWCKAAGAVQPLQAPCACETNSCCAAAVLVLRPRHQARP
jgi:hypothetical protein